jgi:hypothetical protein
VHREVAVLDKQGVVEQVRQLLVLRRAEADKLDRIHAYWRGKQDYPVLPANVPREVKHLAAMSRVNMVTLVVDVLAQALFVDGFRAPRAAENDEAVWDIWQANRMDSKQIGLHRAILAYGAAYEVVLPGDPHSVIRCVSPRHLTAAYRESDDEWPVYALEVRRTGKQVDYRLYDDEAVYFVSDVVQWTHDGSLELSDDAVFVDGAEHGMGVCPVVRFRNHEDLDDDSCLLGEIEPVIPLQDQIDHTTFGLLVAQHFQAFKQRYLIGWAGVDEAAAAATAASRLWVFDDPDVKVGEFGEVNLAGYLDSRVSSTELLATLSQTPPHHLLGKLVNLSAEALAAAEVGQRRKVAERETTWGESHEQALRLAGEAEGIDVPDDAQVRWRDTEARSLAQVVDALGKMVQMLQVPPEFAWEMIPGLSDQDLERLKALAASNNALTDLNAILERQTFGSVPEPGDDEDELVKKANAMGVLIRAGVDPTDAAARVGLPGLRFTGAVPVSLRVPADAADELEARGGRDNSGRSGSA